MYYLPVSKTLNSIVIPEDTIAEKKKKKKLQQSQKYSPSPTRRGIAPIRSPPKNTTTHNSSSPSPGENKKKGHAKFHVPESIRGRHRPPVGPTDDIDPIMAMMDKHEIDIPPRFRDKKNNPGVRRSRAEEGKEFDLDEIHTVIRSFVGLVPRTTCGVCGHIFLLKKLACRISGKSILDLKKSWGNEVNMTLGHLYGSKEVCCFCAQFFGVYIKEYDAFSDQVEILHKPILREDLPKVVVNVATATPPRQSKLLSATAGSTSRRTLYTSLRYVRTDPSGPVPCGSRVVLTPDDIPATPAPVPHTPTPKPVVVAASSTWGPGDDSCDPVLPEELIDDSVDVFECLIIAVTQYSSGLAYLPNHVAASLDRLKQTFECRNVAVTALFNTQVTPSNVEGVVHALCDRITRKSVVFVVVVGMAVCTNVRGVLLLTTDLNTTVSLEKVKDRITSVAPRTVLLLDVLNVKWPPRSSSEGVVIHSVEATPGVLLRQMFRSMKSPDISSLADFIASLSQGAHIEVCGDDPIPFPGLGETTPMAAGIAPHRRLLVGTSTTTRHAPSTCLRTDDWQVVAAAQDSTDVRWGVLLRCWLGHITEARGAAMSAGLGMSGIVGRFEFHSGTHTMLIVRTPRALMEAFVEGKVRSLLTTIIDDVYTFEMYEIREDSDAGDDAVYGACLLARTRHGAQHVDVVV